MATLAERVKAAEEAAQAAEAEVSTPAFLEEEAARRAMSEADERRRAAEQRKREQIAGRMLDAAHERMGDGAELEAVIIEAKPHIFIVSPAGGKAYQTYQTGMRDAATDKIVKGTRDKVRREDVDRIYAVGGIVSWNADGKDVDLDDETTDAGQRLHAMLRAEPAIVTQLIERIARMDGAASEARKR